jgi:hypothetical protein
VLCGQAAGGFLLDGRCEVVVADGIVVHAARSQFDIAVLEWDLAKRRVGVTQLLGNEPYPHFSLDIYTLSHDLALIGPTVANRDGVSEKWAEPDDAFSEGRTPDWRTVDSRGRGKPARD